MNVHAAMTDPRLVRVCGLLLDQADEVACSSAHIIRAEEPAYLDFMGFEEEAKA